MLQVIYGWLVLAAVMMNYVLIFVYLQ